MERGLDNSPHWVTESRKAETHSDEWLSSILWQRSTSISHYLKLHIFCDNPHQVWINISVNTAWYVTAYFQRKSGNQWYLAGILAWVGDDDRMALSSFSFNTWQIQSEVIESFCWFRTTRPLTRGLFFSIQYLKAEIWGFFSTLLLNYFLAVLKAADSSSSALEGEHCVNLRNHCADTSGKRGAL